MFDLLILSLATWRLSVLVMDDEGPYDILEKLRYNIGVRYDTFSLRYGQNTLTKGLICIYCNTIWIGILIALFYFFYPAIAVAIGLPFALSAIAITFGKVVDKL